MIIPIADSTKNKIVELASKQTLRTRAFDNVEPLAPPDALMKEIVMETLDLSGEFQSCHALSNSLENGLYGFNTIGMHVDCITPIGFFVLIIPVLGRGEFFHYSTQLNTGGEIHEFKFRAKSQQAVIFNDRLPHSFTSSGRNCAALAFAVRADSLLK